MDFHDVLSPETRSRLKAERGIMEGLYRMTDVFLGHNLLRLSRTARIEAPRELGDPTAFGYEIGLVWHVAPLLARRLGAGPLRTNEGIHPNFVVMSDEELRLAVGNYLRNADLATMAERRRPDASRPCALDVLGSDFVNGNPIAMAIDRIRPPTSDADDGHDWLVRHMREIGRARFGHERFLAWEPAFQERDRTRGFDEDAPEDDFRPGM